jgi:hypothetical protein
VALPRKDCLVKKKSYWTTSQVCTMQPIRYLWESLIVEARDQVAGGQAITLRTAGRNTP